MTKDEFIRHAMTLYEFCDYPAVKYKILFSLLDVPYGDERLVRLREEFLNSDIVEEMYQLQDINGGWGKLRSHRSDQTGQQGMRRSVSSVELYCKQSLRYRGVFL